MPACHEINTETIAYTCVQSFSEAEHHGRQTCNAGIRSPQAYIQAKAVSITKEEQIKRQVKEGQQLSEVTFSVLVRNHGFTILWIFFAALPNVAGGIACEVVIIQAPGRLFPI